MCRWVSYHALGKMRTETTDKDKLLHASRTLNRLFHAAGHALGLLRQTNIRRNRRRRDGEDGIDA